MPKLRKIALLASLILSLTCAAAWAAGDAPASSVALAPAKIGYVYAQRILEETKAGKKIKRELDGLANEKRTKLEALKDEIMKLDDDLAKKQLVLSLEAKSKMEEDIRHRQLELKRYQEDSLAVLKRFEKEALKKINDISMQIIQKIGEDERYSLILEVRESNILYANSNLDITDKVIQAYDKQDTTPGE